MRLVNAVFPRQCRILPVSFILPTRCMPWRIGQPCRAGGLALLLSLLCWTVFHETLLGQKGQSDWRRFSDGFEIPSEGYCDQPYVVVNSDGTWLCVMTTGQGNEGQSGQHIVASRSADKGKSWSPLIDVEPADGPAASWAMPLRTPDGRVYVFYTYNKDRLEVNGRLGGSGTKRVDTQGHYAYKWSDDGGQSWSADRAYLPLRNLRFDFKNPLGPDVHLFWGIGKPIIDRGEVFLGASKIAYFGNGFMGEDQGIIFRSKNVLTEADPSRHVWTMLPEGDEGLGSVKGPVCDEHNLMALSDGTLYAMARTVEGHPVHYYSADRGRSWTEPEYATYTPEGQKFRHPRACPRIWKTRDGRFLFWFHNNGHRWYNSGEASGSRNLAWLSGGVEKGGRLYWSQPELVRYVDNLMQGCSYPDLVEDQGRYYISATQKTSARIAEIPGAWLEKLWSQPSVKEVAQEGLILDLPAAQLQPRSQQPMPALPDLALGGGFSIDLSISLRYMEPGQILLDSHQGRKGGITLKTASEQRLELTISDGVREFTWDTDRGLLSTDRPHQVTFIVDGGPKLLSVIVDGRLCDGGESDLRKYGYGRFHQSEFRSREEVEERTEIGNVSGGSSLLILPEAAEGTQLDSLRLYNRILMTTEAVGNYRAGAAGAY